MKAGSWIGIVTSRHIAQNHDGCEGVAHALQGGGFFNNQLRRHLAAPLQIINRPHRFVVASRMDELIRCLLAIKAGLPCTVFRFAAEGFSRRGLCAGGFLDGLGAIERGQA